MAGVGWVEDEGRGVVKKGEIKMWDVRQGYVGLLLINTHTWHTPPPRQLMCLILVQPSCQPSAQMWYNLRELGGWGVRWHQFLERRVRYSQCKVVSFWEITGAYFNVISITKMVVEGSVMFYVTLLLWGPARVVFHSLLELSPLTYLVYHSADCRRSHSKAGWHTSSWHTENLPLLHICVARMPACHSQ